MLPEYDVAHRPLRPLLSPNRSFEYFNTMTTLPSYIQPNYPRGVEDATDAVALHVMGPPCESSSQEEIYMIREVSKSQNGVETHTECCLCVKQRAAAYAGGHQAAGFARYE